MKRYNSRALHKETRVWFFAAFGLLLFVGTLYMYFLSASVVHVVMRKELNQEIAEVSSYVSQLEAQYIEAQHNVSDHIASLEGYVVADEKIFIDRTEDVLVLSGRNDR